MYELSKLLMPIIMVASVTQINTVIGEVVYNFFLKQFYYTVSFYTEGFLSDSVQHCIILVPLLRK